AMESLIAVLPATIISLLALVGFTHWAKLGVQNVQNAATAQQMVIFNSGALQYSQDNAATLNTMATTTVPVTISADTLSAAGYLPAGFMAKNPFGQTWQLQVLKTATGQLQELVTSQGGAAISDTKQLVQIAAQAGAQGGFIPFAGQGGDSSMQPTSAN